MGSPVRTDSFLATRERRFRVPASLPVPRARGTVSAISRASIAAGPCNRYGSEYRRRLAFLPDTAPPRQLSARLLDVLRAVDGSALRVAAQRPRMRRCYRDGSKKRLRALPSLCTVPDRSMLTNSDLACAVEPPSGCPTRTLLHNGPSPRRLSEEFFNILNPSPRAPHLPPARNPRVSMPLAQRVVEVKRVDALGARRQDVPRDRWRGRMLPFQLPLSRLIHPGFFRPPRRRCRSALSGVSPSFARNSHCTGAERPTALRLCECASRSSGSIVTATRGLGVVLIVARPNEPRVV
ncbi:unnamed protein product, partial [Iphiclides podalirius]